MIFEVKGQSINLVDADTLIQYTETPYKVGFAFDEAWEGFTRQVIFRVGEKNAAIRLNDGNKCTLPSEFLEDGGVYLYVMVEGFAGGNTISTNWCIAGKVLHNIDIDTGGGVDPNPSDPGTYEELKKAIGDVSQLKTESGDLTGAVNELKEAIDNGGGDEGCQTATDEEVEAMLNEVFGN